MSKEDNKFTVLHSKREANEGMPDFVKWSELSEEWAQKNHGQTLERLAERGGLSPREIAANVKGKQFREILGTTWAAIKILVNEIAA